MRIYEAEREAFARHFGYGDAAISTADAKALVARYAPDVDVRRGGSTIASRFYSRKQAPQHTHLSGRMVLGHQAGLPVVLHELAHALSDASGAPHGHGTDFQRHYLTLVRNEMAPYWERRLRASIRRHKPRGWKSALTLAASDIMQA